MLRCLFGAGLAGVCLLSAGCGPTAGVEVMVQPHLAFDPISPHAYGDAPLAVNATSLSPAPIAYSLVSGPGTLSGKTVTLTSAGTVVLSATQPATATYAGATAQISFDVARAGNALLFMPIGPHTYGDRSFVLVATSTSASTGPITYQVMAGPGVVSGNRLTLQGAGTIVVRATQAADPNYVAATVDTSVSVAKAASVFDFAFVPTHTFGDAPFAVNAASDSSGAVTYALVSGPASVSGNIVTLTGAGRVTLSASQASDANYLAGTATAAFSVARAPNSVTFDAIPAHAFGDAPFTVSATSSSRSSSPVTYQLVSGPATLAGQTVTLTGAGSVVLSASQAIDTNYAAATAETTLPIARATNSLILSPIPDQVFSNPPPTVTLAATSSTSSTSVITYAVVSGPGTVSGSVLTISGAGQMTVRATQASDANYRAATAQTSFQVTNANHLLTFDGIASHTFGDPPFTVTASSGATTPIVYSVVSGPATISGRVVTLTGAGSVVLRADQAADANYSAQTAQSSFAVAKGSATLAFVPVTGVIDGDPPFAVSATSKSTGAVTYSLVSGPATLSGDRVTVTGAGTVTLAARQASDANYAVSTAQTTFTVAAPNTSATGLIEHVVVIFQENVSFDHYFATYPNATNPAGEPLFTALPNTPAVDGLSPRLLTRNPNAANIRNGAGAINPFRLDPANAATADQDHNYQAEQMAFNGGAMDLFPLSVGAADGPALATNGPAATTGLTMGYFDGNTVTGLWNYAQHFALSDHFFATNFGPSTPGAINLVSGQTNGVVNDGNAQGGMLPDGYGGSSIIGDPDPFNDICSNVGAGVVHMIGRNIGDLMNSAGISWGFFTDGFDPTLVNPNGTTGCRRSHHSTITGRTTADYIPHHQPFQYYASTANPTHARPVSTSLIGKAGDGGTAHQYDLHDFFDALAAGNFPTVSYLKAPAYQDGHAGYSDPLDEQAFIVSVLNTIQKTPQWSKTVVLIAYDDSDGWYDHEFKIVNGSAGAGDAFTSKGFCADGTTALPGVASATLHAQGRCGYGPRLPFLVVSPWAKPNYVDSNVLDQTSIMRFIEDTFLNGQRVGQGSFDTIAAPINPLLDLRRSTPQNMHTVLLDPVTGVVTSVN
ncbi:Phospholipase C [Granulicella pectinivorans]|uniref:Phospholipase C n=1 Tax=Granulicella pectinivorans TaxID=474950 RepID=A0A1I6L4L1_9BACT|nr:alkaline phosphatase family protein [Granulicella pectinivorans]SFR98423.1 Phospholipase C [Granulicella pectinivorans]